MPTSTAKKKEAPKGDEMFSQATQYAIRAVVMLAYHRDHGPVGNAWLAETAKIPPSYLAKVLQGLVKGGIIGSRRGAKGGFTLLRPPESITLLDVVNAVEPLPRIRGCPLGLKSHAGILCPVHARLDEAMAQVEAVLSSATIAELLSDDSRPPAFVESLGFLKTLLENEQRR
jgi:Rrf2 family protein